MARILVVDDEAMVLESIRMTLASCGFQVATAGSGREALAKLSSANYELVVTDRKMPGMTGEQLAVDIKAQWPRIPVIMLTGFPPDNTPEAVDAILQKPFSTPDLRGLIERLTKPRA
jgi:CheY-like chemotaxis protein